MFDPESRYYSLPNLVHRTRDGREIVYKQRRLVPRTPPAGETTLAQGERLDLVAARALGNPRLYWRICDVNRELDPFRIEEETGRELKLP